MRPGDKVLKNESRRPRPAMEWPMAKVQVPGQTQSHACGKASPVPRATAKRNQHGGHSRSQSRAAPAAHVPPPHSAAAKVHWPQEQCSGRYLRYFCTPGFPTVSDGTLSTYRLTATDGNSSNWPGKCVGKPAVDGPGALPQASAATNHCPASGQHPEGGAERRSTLAFSLSPLTIRFGAKSCHVPVHPRRV